MAVSSASGGPPNQTQLSAGDYRFLYQIFGVMSNEINSAKLLVCPSDSATPAWTNLLIGYGFYGNNAVSVNGKTMYTMCNSNVSYFIGLEATENFPSMLLSGDRNIYGGLGVLANDNATSNSSYGDANHIGAYGVLGASWANTSPPEPGWTGLMHQQAGNVLLCDGSVQQVNSPNLRTLLQNSGDTNPPPIGPNALLLP
jgi:prepilin-type processing-associated H-X9-DG protein